MADSISYSFPIRLKQARQMRGLSMDALASKLDSTLSKQSISKYEKGLTRPDSRHLIALAKALEVSPDFLLRPVAYSIKNIEFRKKARLGQRKIEAIKALVKDEIERYFEIEQLYGMPQVFRRQDYSDTPIADSEGVVSVVRRLKKEWQIGDDGINNLIELLEDNMLKVIEIDAEEAFDGMSGLVDGKIPVIVLNKNYSSERKRFTALHELGHLTLNFADNIDKTTIERMCNLFASEMLVSSETLIKKLGACRADISTQELIGLQKQFGISIDALMYKARQLGIITERRHATYCKKKNRLPEFKALVEENRTKDETSERFERLVFRGLADELISLSKAGVLLRRPLDLVRAQFVVV